MSELFPTQESLSPKLKWMKQHGIKTYFSKGLTEEEEPWCAWQGTWEDISKKCVTMEEDGSMVTDISEEECLWKLSQNLKIHFYK